MTCKNCKNRCDCKERKAFERLLSLGDADCSGYEPDTMPDKITNYDRIRNMSVEEMSTFLMDWAMRFMLGKAPLNVESWLESEVDNNAR